MQSFVLVCVNLLLWNKPESQWHNNSYLKKYALWTLKAHLMSEVQYLKIAQIYFSGKTFLKNKF